MDEKVIIEPSTGLTQNQLALVIALYIQNDLLPIANNPITKFTLSFAMNTVKANPDVITNFLNQHPIFSMIFADDEGKYDASMFCTILRQTLNDQGPLHLDLKTESFDIPASDVDKLEEYIKEVKANG